MKNSIPKDMPETGEALWDRGMELLYRNESKEEAYKCFMEGRRKGDDVCTLYAAICVLSGLGVRRDATRAIRLLEELAQQTEGEDIYVIDPSETAHRLLALLTPLLKSRE